MRMNVVHLFLGLVVLCGCATSPTPEKASIDLIVTSDREHHDARLVLTEGSSATAAAFDGHTGVIETTLFYDDWREPDDGLITVRVDRLYSDQTRVNLISFKSVIGHTPINVVQANCAQPGCVQVNINAALDMAKVEEPKEKEDAP